MKQQVIGIADMGTSADPNAVIVTFALGSCIALILHDPVRRCGGMLHYMLPQSLVSPDQARERPFMFADTGVPMLFSAMLALGCRKKDLVTKVTGGGQILDDRGVFNIGGRNHAALHKILAEAAVSIAAEDVGGSHCRTPRLYVATGRVTITTRVGVREL